MWVVYNSARGASGSKTYRFKAVRGAGGAIEGDEGGVRSVRACGGAEDGEELEHRRRKGRS